MAKQRNRDYGAGELVKLLRENLGLSRHDLATAMIRDHPADSRYHASARQLARIEDDGVVPGARVKFAVAHALSLQPSQIWGGRGLVSAPFPFSPAEVVAA